MSIDDSMLTEIDDRVRDTFPVLVRDTGELGDVVLIEIEAEEAEDKIYCYGSTPDKLVVCHNVKIADYNL
ncbi:MAG: hypothetical protein ABI539_15225, partial [Acidobacteriota bacterium]